MRVVIRADMTDIVCSTEHFRITVGEIGDLSKKLIFKINKKNK